MISKEALKHLWVSCEAQASNVAAQLRLSGASASSKNMASKSWQDTCQAWAAAQARSAGLHLGRSKPQTLASDASEAHEQVGRTHGVPGVFQEVHRLPPEAVLAAVQGCSKGLGSRCELIGSHPRHLST